MESSSKERRRSLLFGSEELKERNDELRRQMEEMRSSSEGELLKAWAEVEELQDEKEEILEINQDLIMQLEAAKEREDQLLKQIQASQQKGPVGNFRSLLSGVRNKSSRSLSITSKTSELNDSAEFDLVSTKLENEEDNQKRITQSNETADLSSPLIQKAIQSAIEKIEKDFTTSLRRIEEEKNEMVKTWKYKLKCKEGVVDTLEKEGIRQKENLKRLRNEIMQREADAQVRSHEHKCRVNTLKKKVEEKRSIIAKQYKKIKQYRGHIDDLTSLLQKVSGVEKIPTNKQTSIPRPSIDIMKRQTKVPASA